MCEVDGHRAAHDSTSKRYVVGYFAVGSGCVKCETLPWIGIGLLLILPLSGGMIWFEGFTISIYTKAT